MSDLPESPKDRGHLAELVFAAEAAKRGYTVLTPGGDNSPFDIVLYNGKRFIRVQIKSCLKKEADRDRYTFTIKQGGPNTHRAYVDIDVFGLYSFATKEWFLVPLDVVPGETTIKIDSSGRFDQYKENWTIFE